MIIILTAEESEDQLISGIPEYVDFETNIPATVFYTLNGEDPTESSDIAIGRVFLPTNKNSVTLKAYAVAGSFSSAVFSDTYFTTQPDVENRRFYFGDGVTVLPYGEDVVDSRSFDSEGNPAQETSTPFVDLDVQASFYNSIGEPLTESTVSFINRLNRTSGAKRGVSSNPSDSYFDPTARFIIINGSTQDEMNAQQVKIINRPSGTFSKMGSVNKNGISDIQHSGGGLTKYMYNSSTGTIVFYYYDPVQSRYLQSIQKIEPKTLELSPVRNSAGGIVFRWINNRTMTKIY